METSHRFPLAVFCLFTFISMLGIGIAFPTFSFVVLQPEAHFILSKATEEERTVTLGVLLSLTPLASFIMAPILGVMADERGRKPLILFALCLMFLGTLMTAIGIWLDSLLLLILSRLIAGIGAGGTSALSAAVADISPAEKKAQNFALLSTCSSLGFMLGPLLGGKLAAHGNYALPFFAMAFLILTNLILIYFVFTDSFHVAKKESKGSLLADLKYVFSYPKIRFILLSAPLFTVGFVIYYQFISINWIEQYGLNEKQVGDLYAYGAACFALSSGLLIRPLLSRFQNLSLSFFASLGLGLITLALVFRTGISWFWASLPLQEFCMALLGASAIAFISNQVKKEDQGKTMGVVQSLTSASFAVSPLLGGYISGLNYNGHILLGGILILLFALALLLGYREEVFMKKT